MVARAPFSGTESRLRVVRPVIRSMSGKNRGSDCASSTRIARPLRSTAPAMPRSQGTRSGSSRTATSAAAAAL